MAYLGIHKQFHVAAAQGVGWGRTGGEISPGAKILKMCTSVPVQEFLFSLSAVGSYQIILTKICIHICVYVCVRKIASAVWVIDSRGKIGWTNGPVVYLTQALSQGLWSKGRGNTLGDTQEDELAGFGT